jgi:hypothetical protein
LSLDFLGYIVINIVFQATDVFYTTPWIRPRRKEIEYAGRGDKKFSLPMFAGKGIPTKRPVTEPVTKGPDYQTVRLPNVQLPKVQITLGRG